MLCDVRTTAVPPNASSKSDAAGFRSDEFPVAKGGIYMWTFAIKLQPGSNGTGSCNESDGGVKLHIGGKNSHAFSWSRCPSRESKNAKPYLKISCAVVPTEPSSWTADGASGTPPGMSCDGLWRTYSGTMLADRESDGKAQISVTMPAVRTIGGVACKGPCAGNLTGYVGKWWIVRPAYFLDLRAFLT